MERGAEEGGRRRSERKTASKRKAGARDLVSSGYEQFTAREHTHGDGTGDCEVTLHLTLKDDHEAVEGIRASYAGSTGNGRGHAEMDALQSVIEAMSSRVVDFRKYEIGIKCTAKSCCIRCSAVMGLIGATPVGKTFKSQGSFLGGGSWSLTPTLRTFLAKLLGVTEDELMGMNS